MTDTWADFAEELRDASLGANLEDFAQWLHLSFSEAPPISELRRALSSNDRDVLDALRDKYWDEYIADLEYCDRAEREAKLH